MIYKTGLVGLGRELVRQGHEDMSRYFYKRLCCAKYALEFLNKMLSICKYLFNFFNQSRPYNMNLFHEFIPYEIRNSNSLTKFKKMLKTYLFKAAFKD